MKTVKTAFFYQFTLPSGAILHIDNEEAGEWLEQLQARVLELERGILTYAERAEKAEAALKETK
jgi:hypothetical protein